ncbi:hypothetical protein Tco_0923966 [Tanacetum coccineum]|uniref:Uncharacterized protein n=1 Tax=Tanacetum coccineum TaxID=301880 RepID=A0ABQ5D3W3_9ASTR
MLDSGLIYFLDSDLMKMLDSGLLNLLDSDLILLNILICARKPLRDNMANENVPAPAPTRSDDQILPFTAWVPIGKSNFVLDLQKKQKNLIFQISMDILQNPNFFRAFTTSDFLDEDWFILDANLLRKALEITLVDQAHQFVSPPLGDAIMDFVNQLGYPGEIYFVSRMAVNNLYQPWRAILSMINQCLTGKTSGFDRPRYPVLQMLWAMQTFLADKANLSIAPQKGKKTKRHVIPYCQFTKLIICHLGRTHNNHQRSASPLHLAEEDHRLGNLKFVPKGKEEVVFGMQIPKDLITNNIRNAPYNAYMEMVAKHDKKITAEKGGKKKAAAKADQSKKPTTAKQSKPVPSKQSKPAPATKPKVTQEKTSVPSLEKHPKRGKVQKVRKGKGSLKLIDEDEEVQHEPEPQGEGEDFDLNRAIQMSLETFQAHGQAPVGGVTIREQVEEATRPLPTVKGKGKAIATDEQATQSLLALHTPKRRSTTDQFIFQRRTPATEKASTGPSTQPQDDASANIVRDSPSPADADITTITANTEVLYAEDVQGEEISHTVVLEENIAELDEGQTGSYPGKTPESRPLPEHEHMDEDQAGPNPEQSHEALAGPNPKPMHDDFIAIVYPKVHESLKHTTEEHAHLENPLSSSGTLSSMKNLDDAFTFDDQFLNDKPMEGEPGKTTMETEAESMVNVPIHQASTSVPPLSTPIIDVSPPKPVSSPLQEPVIAATTEATTTTLPLPPPPQQQSTTDSSLASRVLTLEQRCADLEKKHKLQDKTTQALSSRIFILELRDLPHKINQTVNEAVKEAVHVALQAPLRDRFRELPEADMKEILHQRMFESGTYKSLPEYVAFYEALKASMEHANQDEFLAEKDKSRKRRRDDQDPPLPPLDSDLSKKKRQDTVEDVPIPDDMNISGSEDTDSAHLPKIKTRPDWLNLIPDEDRPITSEPDWVIPPNDLLEIKNNWANALASSYQDPDEYKLLWQTGDMSSFINWFCKRIGKKKLSKADLEGPTFKVV